MEALFIGIKYQETELKQCNYAKYSHTKAKLHRRGLKPGPCHCVLTATEMTLISMGLTCNPIANVHHHSHTAYKIALS